MSKAFRYIPYTHSQRRRHNADRNPSELDEFPLLTPLYQLPTALVPDWPVIDIGRTPDYVLKAHSPGLWRARKRNQRNKRIARKEGEEQMALEREEEEFNPNN